MWTSEDIANRFPSVTNEDLKGLSNSAYASKVVLYYPFNDKTEKVDFDGYFISSQGSGVYRYSKIFYISKHTWNNKVVNFQIFTLTKFPIIMFIASLERCEIF